jgi:hypothetical protein
VVEATLEVVAAEVIKFNGIFPVLMYSAQKKSNFSRINSVMETLLQLKRKSSKKLKRKPCILLRTLQSIFRNKLTSSKRHLKKNRA